jgi:hypothetical protein
LEKSITRIIELTEYTGETCEGMGMRLSGTSHILYVRYLEKDAVCAGIEYLDTTVINVVPVAPAE